MDFDRLLRHTTWCTVSSLSGVRGQNLNDGRYCCKIIIIIIIIIINNNNLKKKKIIIKKKGGTNVYID